MADDHSCFILPQDGWTALMIASQNGHLETVKALLAAVAAVDIQEEVFHGIACLLCCVSTTSV